MKNNVIPGQVWQNGKTAVKVQGRKNKLELVTFSLSDDTLRFKNSRVCNELKALEYLNKLNCIPTDKVLAAVEQ